jgi:hypothetical protein
MVIARMAIALLCFHFAGSAVLVSVMWESSASGATRTQSASDYLRSLAKDMCRTIPAATGR